MMFYKLLLALTCSTALAEPQGLRGADENCCKNCPREPFCSTKTKVCHWGKQDPNVNYLECNSGPQSAGKDGTGKQDVPEGYLRRSLVKDEGKPLKDYYRIDLATCARLCNELPNCNSFAYTSQHRGKCHLKSKVITTSDVATKEEHQGFSTYFKKAGSEKPEGESKPEEKPEPEKPDTEKPKESPEPEKPEPEKPESEKPETSQPEELVEKPQPEKPESEQPEASKTKEEPLGKPEPDPPHGYTKRGLVEEGGKTLADVSSIDLQTCALFCDTLPTCKSFDFTAPHGGRCLLKDKVVTASEKSAQADQGHYTYYKEKQQEQETAGESDEEVPSADPSQVYHDLEGISSTWQNFIVCRGGRVCRGGWYRGVCRGGFYCRRSYR
eukprot:TRINITY_DN277_c0_g1_i3.p1 TRINITY_DN277_c0_g1~~TRINITY_DN277_c0_g1_i3.p1  ORF type:complete len:383 (+),score=98.68 TRINITY_DN277_c0_g1_i3:82-1230(+)